MSAGYSSRRLRSENDLPRPFSVRLGLFILKLIAFTPVPLARPIGAPATTLRWHLGAQAPVCGRSQLSPTGAFNPAAASPAPAAEELDRLIESSTAVNGKLSRDDIRVLPLLRSAAVVKAFGFRARSGTISKP